MLGDIVITAGVAILLALLFVATVPIAGTRAWRALWGSIVFAGALAIVVWPAIRPKPDYGMYVVINDSANAVIAQLEGPGPFNAWQIDPGAYGPFVTIAIDRAIGIYSLDCQPIGHARIEGYHQGTVVRADGSVRPIDLGHLTTPPEATSATGCPVSLK